MIRHSQGTLWVCTLQEIHLELCAFQQPVAWVLQLPSLQQLAFHYCDVPWQQSVWLSCPPALRSFVCHNVPLNKARRFEASETHGYSNAEATGVLIPLAGLCRCACRSAT